MRLTIAHRAGNDLVALRQLDARNVDLIEADVHLFRGRLEVRHLKTAGPVPLLWDRWKIASPFAPRLFLNDLLAQAGSSAELMLDLKGRNERLPGRVVDAIARHLRDRKVTVCSRNWRLLAPLQAEPHIRVVYSIGSRRQLRAFLGRFTSEASVAGISIRDRLLDPQTVGELRMRSAVVMVWGVEDHERMATIRSWGVNGLISEDPDLLRGFVADLGRDQTRS